MTPPDEQQDPLTQPTNRIFAVIDDPGDADPRGRGPRRLVA